LQKQSRAALQSGELAAQGLALESNHLPQVKAAQVGCQEPFTSLQFAQAAVEPALHTKGKLIQALAVVAEPPVN
jgi:hypothetical protein